MELPLVLHPIIKLGVRFEAEDGLDSGLVGRLLHLDMPGDVSMVRDGQRSHPEVKRMLDVLCGEAESVLIGECGVMV